MLMLMPMLDTTMATMAMECTPMPTAMPTTATTATPMPTTTARGLLMPSPPLMLMPATSTADTATDTPVATATLTTATTATPMLTVIIINLLDIVKELRT